MPICAAVAALLLPLQAPAGRPPQAPASTEVVELELPPGLPERLQLELTLAGRPVRLDLARHSLRAPGAFVRVVGADGAARDVAPPPVTTYRGTVNGAGVVLASLHEDGLHARIELDSLESYEIEPAGPGRALHAVHPASPPPDFTCGSADDAVLLPGGLQGLSAQPLLPRCLRKAEIAFDADFAYFQAKGSSVANVVAAVDSILDQVEYFYARDVQITYELTAYVVRTAPFYTPTSGGDLLDQFRIEWITNQAAIPRDVAHLMTGEPGSVIQYGGLAWVGVVCDSSYHYGWSMDSAYIVGHELGHNWGAGHCHDLSPCNNMCGACFYVAPVTREIILAFRDSRPCLDHDPGFAQELPPYAAPDGVERRKDELATGAPLRLAVLRNDDDGNCGPLHVGAFDRTSDQGADVRRAPRSPAEVRDELLYTPPAVPFVGADRFGYEASDGRRSTAAEVTVESLPLELAACYPLDEGAGAIAGDAGRLEHDGTVSGAAWTAGKYGGALSFDGTDDAVVLPALGLASNHVTITAWVLRQGAQSSFASLVFSRAGNTVAGLHFGSGAGLRYTWNGDPATYDWVSGVQVPDGRWTFVALVVEPERATIYTRDAALLSATNAVPHAPEEFDGATHVGLDPVGGRAFRGRIDDVRIFPYSLTAAEVAALAELGGPADSPLPRDGGKLFDAGVPLEWLAGPLATGHDVYLGTSFAVVRAATPLSPEFLGTFATASAAPGPIAPDTTWFWRVDELTPAGPVPGHVWQFELAGQHRWRLDETSGTTAFDSAGGLNGTYLGGVTLGQPGATPSLGASAAFDGANDRIEAGALGLASDRVTITAWVRRDGSQNSWTGLVFSRAASTAAGLHFGTANELRYTWNNGEWNWSSGLVVPDAAWVFTALVVEPSRARLYLGQGGTVASATHAASHAPEEFDGTTVIGRDPSSSSRSFRGRLDDVRVFDHALSQAEVEALYLGSL